MFVDGGFTERSVDDMDTTDAHENVISRNLTIIITSFPNNTSLVTTRMCCRKIMLLKIKN